MILHSAIPLMYECSQATEWILMIQWNQLLALLEFFFGKFFGFMGFLEVNSAFSVFLGTRTNQLAPPTIQKIYLAVSFALSHTQLLLGSFGGSSCCIGMVHYFSLIHHLCSDITSFIVFFALFFSVLLWSKWLICNRRYFMYFTHFVHNYHMQAEYNTEYIFPH